MCHREGCSKLPFLPGREDPIPNVLPLSHSPAPPQIAQERKTKLEVTPEAKVKTSQPQPGSQGPQTYRQGVGKYINPAAT